MAKIEIDVSEVVDGFNDLSKKLGDMSGFFRNVAELELEDTKFRFLSEVDPDDIPWPEPKTYRRNPDGGYRKFSSARGDKILRDTGNLFNSISADWGRDYAVVGTNLEYAEALQVGRFPFVGITSRTEDNIVDAFEAYLSGSL